MQQHLMTLMLLASKYHWDAILSFHNAMLHQSIMVYPCFLTIASLKMSAITTPSLHSLHYQEAALHFTNSGALLTVTSTKTGRSGDTALIVPVLHVLGSPLCPTFACLIQSFKLLYSPLLPPWELLLRPLVLSILSLKMPEQIHLLLVSYRVPRALGDNKLL